MKVLLSVKPEYSQRIFAGTKRYEFRKVIFSRPVDTIVVYESSPTQRIVGHFRVGSVLSGPPEEIWRRTQDEAGVDEASFYRYFSGRDVAYAIEVMEPTLYECPLPLSDFYGSRPPQSFVYLEE